jgi:prepilin-type N-terminal cleavage/methylation domain-containing protein
MNDLVRLRLVTCGGQGLSRRGFSLIELLAVIGITSILIGLALPSLGGIRERASRLKCSAQLAGHMQVLAVYAADSDDYWPFYWPENRVAPRPPYVPDEPPPTMGDDDWYLAIAGLWYAPMIDAYGGTIFNESLHCPADEDWALTREMLLDLIEQQHADIKQVRYTINYTMSAAMYLDPAALDPEHPGIEPRHYIGQRQTDVLFPSQKAALYECLPLHDKNYHHDGVIQGDLFYSRNIAACDGSVAYRHDRDLIPGVLVPGHYDPEYEDLYQNLMTLEFTPNGVHGRDW